MIKTVLRSVLLLTLAGPVSAQTLIQGRATGLTGSFSFIDFNALGIADNSPLTNQLHAQGVLFSNAVFGMSGGFGGSAFTTSAVYNYTALYDQLGSLTMQFTSARTGVAFNLATLPGPTTFEAFLGNISVSKFVGMTANTSQSAALFWGFENASFDRIVITSDAPNGPAVGLDNLQIATVPIFFPHSVTTVPEPSTLALLLGGSVVLGFAGSRRRRRR